MFKKLFLVSCAALALAGAPHYFNLSDAGTAPAEAGKPQPTQTAALAAAAPATPAASYVGGARGSVIPMDSSGHFVADFRINGRAVRGVVDTGATYIAINETVARSIGLRLAGSDFQYEVRTANGTTKAARAVLDRVEIGQIRVADVEAFVLKDSALSGTLVGMSFMSRLGSYRVEGNNLHMSQ